jgi:hypothetical protein
MGYGLTMDSIFPPICDQPQMLKDTDATQMLNAVLQGRDASAVLKSV